MDYPAPKSQPKLASRINLPSVLTSFVGREREQRDITAALASARLLTLTGAGGCGKTRLAMRVAEQASDHYADGVFWVELAQLTDPAFAPQVVADAVGAMLDAGANRPAGEALAAYLRDQQVLIVLDNCEHLVAACAELAGRLLGAPGLTVLATSREPLGLAGERLYPLAALDVPAPNVPTAQLQSFDAVRLFIVRARARLPGFALTAANAPVVASICRQLDGLPLAIELASARVNVMSVEQIAGRLDSRLAWLVAPERVPAAHHRTLRAAIDWSYDLLSPAEQGLLRRLSVFAGGCTLESAEAASGKPPGQVLDGLTSLVNKSLVAADTLGHSEARYSLLETIRQYAAEKQAAAGEVAVARDRHLRRFVQLAEETAPKLHGPYQQLWLNWLEAEHDNVRAALGWAVESRALESGLRLANAMIAFWEMRAHVAEAARWYERLLALPRAGAPLEPLVTGLTYATHMAMKLGQAEAAMPLGREAVALAESAGPEAQPSLLANALAAMGSAVMVVGDYESLYTIAERPLPLWRKQNDAGGLGMTLLTQGITCLALGRHPAARAALNESLDLFRVMSDDFRAALALNSLGDLERSEDHLALARAAYEESAALLRPIGAAHELASVLHNLAHVCQRLGEIDQALTLLREAVALQQAKQNAAGVAECLTGFATLALAGRQPAAAARLLGATAGLGDQAAWARWPLERKAYEGAVSQARAGLSETEFETEQAIGRTLTMEAAIDYALSLPLGAGPDAAEIQPEPDGLTAREREIVALIGQGRTNAEMAAQLVVSKRTVEKHIANILGKLGLTSRAQIVRWAIARRLATPAD